MATHEAYTEALEQRDAQAREVLRLQDENASLQKERDALQKRLGDMGRLLGATEVGRALNAPQKATCPDCGTAAAILCPRCGAVPLNAPRICQHDNIPPCPECIAQRNAPLSTSGPANGDPAITALLGLRRQAMQMATFLRQHIEAGTFGRTDRDGEGRGALDLLKRWRKADRAAEATYGAASDSGANCQLGDCKHIPPEDFINPAAASAVPRKPLAPEGSPRTSGPSGADRKGSK